MRQLDEEQVGVEVANLVPEQAMTTAYNPFLIQLASKSSISDGVKITLSAGESGYLLCCWGVSIKEIYPVLYMLPTDLRRTFSDGQNALETLQQYCVSCNITRIGCCENTDLTLLPDTTVDLGPVPRECYPLVILVVSDFLTNSYSDDTDHVVFHALVIHLQDSICTAESHVISHLIRTIHGKPVDLKNLYTSAHEDASSSSQPGQVESSPQTSRAMNLDSEDPQLHPIHPGTTAVCIVCQVNTVNKVILPCRHACVCDFCFDKVVKCPMCRGLIKTCFSLGDRQQEDDFSAEHEQPNQHWFIRLNDWLNKKLGFT